MSILDVSDVPNIHPMPAKQEYEVSITKLWLEVSKGAKTAGQSILRVAMDPYNEPEAEEVYDMIAILPDPGDRSKAATKQRAGVKDFCICFGLPLALNFEEGVEEGAKQACPEAVGRTGKVVLGIETYQGKEKNVVTAYLRP